MTRLSGLDCAAYFRRGCSKEGGDLYFNDFLLQTMVERLMTPVARPALRDALGQAVQLSNFVQSQQVLPAFAPEVLPVAEAPHPAGQ